MKEIRIPSHLFVSYASEDKALARWLTLKLTTEGYRVWCDEFKLLGGESYPKDIDEAIKNKTFRVLALLSRHSIKKPNPTAERTTALNIGRERNTDFLIPLNVDGLKPTEIDWMSAPLTFIPFNTSWAQGMAQLLKKLRSVNAPRSLAEGKAIAADTYTPTDLMVPTSEIVFSNCLAFIQIPEVIWRFDLSENLSKQTSSQLAESWAFYVVSPRRALGFTGPPPLATQIRATQAGGACWKNERFMDKISTANIVSCLLRRSLKTKCLDRGLKIAPDGKHPFYFPSGLVKNNRLRFEDANGRRTWLFAVGERSVRRRDRLRETYRYHLGFTLFVWRNLLSDFVCLVRPTLHMTSTGEAPLAKYQAQARRKRVTKDWWNDEWLKRALAICQYIAKGEETISIGTNLSEQVIISSKFETLEVPVSINEMALANSKRPAQSNLSQSEDKSE